MKLKKLLKEISVQDVKGSREVEVTGISSNSRTVAPGNLFIAKKGLTHDGSRFIPDAIASGAVAIATDLYDPFFPDVVQIIHPNVQALEAQIAKAYYNNAAEKLFMVGITGTNGKTTTSYLVKHILEAPKELCGLIGTVEWIVGENRHPSLFTTPDVITNHKLFHEMVINGCSSCVMEVSSHALEQGRVESIDFDVAVFTNLTQDHLDFHKSMENYAAAKAKLFLKQPKTAVVNGDSPWTDSILQGYCGKVMKYGIDCEAALRAHEIQLTPHKTIFNLIYAGQTYSVSSALVGRYNVYNTLAAISVALSKGISIEHILTAVKTFKPVGGRLEPVPNQKKLSIFVDYAHTDDALKNVLETLREFKEGRIITVFGCGGNRDQQKRPKMAKVAETHSDVVIVTSDNPRQEDPQEIIRQIFSGFANPGHAIVEPDRREAIHRAVHMAGPNDLILIAGKGHETYQIFSHQTIEFDDRKIAQEAALS